MKEAQVEIAFLGPTGTYTELALRGSFVDTRLSGRPCRSVAEVVERVSNGESVFGFIPMENLLEGPVTETLDALFAFRDTVEIVGSKMFEISHAIGAIKAVDPRTVAWVRSHPQALQQCASFLHSDFPSAVCVESESTAAAVRQLEAMGDTDGVGAVIGPLETIRSAGLAVLCEEVPASARNRTRFVLLAQRGCTDAPVPRDFSAGAPVTSLIVKPGRDRQGLLFELLEVVSKRCKLNLQSIHSRPDRSGGFVFHLDVEGGKADESLVRCLKELELYCIEATGRTAEIIVAGSYRREPFYDLAFRSIGIVGGAGRMGLWLQGFFEDLGFEVLSCDLQSGVSLSELTDRCDVIFLSVPMQAVPAIAGELRELLRPGQLVVENCSVKSEVLALLERELPEHVEVLGIHTMFGESVGDLHGQNVIAIQSSRVGDTARAFVDLFYKRGARVTEATKEEHDRTAAVQQALLHLLALAFVKTLWESRERSDLSAAMSTPNSRQFLEISARVLAQSADLTSAMQTSNPHCLQFRELFLNQLTALAASCENRDLCEADRRQLQEYLLAQGFGDGLSSEASKRG